jgi:hypothetical protein
MQADASAPDVEFYRQAPALLISQLKQLEGVPPETPVFQETIKNLGMAFVGLQLSLDILNKNYTEKEAFLDQTVAGLVVSEASDAGESGQGEDASSEGDQDYEDVASNSSADPTSSTPAPATTSTASDPSSCATHVILSGLGSVAAVVTAALALAFFSTMMM